MVVDRLNDFITLDKKEISSLFALYQSGLNILDYSLIKDSMSNSGYIVTTSSGKCLLKLYSNTTDKVETAVYKYLKDKLNVPELLYYDGSKKHFPFAYSITEFIEGVTFIQYIRAKSDYPPEIAYEIGKMCAVMHGKKYECDALLDGDLCVKDELPGTREKIKTLLAGKPAKHLKLETVEKLQRFINENVPLFDEIEAGSVLCHGDLNYSNIMISGGKTYFIDFEFAYSGSIYHDIGHFFRRKDADVQALVNENTVQAFSQGYNSVSVQQLPAKWLKLAHLCDISAMLCLLTYDVVPKEWVSDIEYDILSAISLEKF